jgi:hypothetical protein
MRPYLATRCAVLVTAITTLPFVGQPALAAGWSGSSSSSRLTVAPGHVALRFGQTKTVDVRKFVRFDGHPTIFSIFEVALTAPGATNPEMLGDARRIYPTSLRLTAPRVPGTHLMIVQYRVHTPDGWSARGVLRITVG